MAGAIRATAIPTLAACWVGWRLRSSPAACLSRARQPAYNYSQPISTTAAPPEQAVAGQANTAFDQARDAFKAGDYAKALQLDQQALAQTPNDTEPARVPRSGVLCSGQVRPGRRAALRGALGRTRLGLDDLERDVSRRRDLHRPAPSLEASVRANPESAHARFVLAYQYLGQGHVENAVAQLKEVVKLQPARHALGAAHRHTTSPPAAAQPPPAEPATNGAPAFEGKLAGNWVATPVKDAKISLVIKDDGKFNWDASAPGKPPTAIAGASTFADGVLTLAAREARTARWPERWPGRMPTISPSELVGAPPGDPGLKFAAEP